MYESFFGLKENPFNLSPDPAFFFPSPQHQEALSSLIYGVESRKGFLVLTGEVGTGKTTVLECLRDFLNSRMFRFACIFNSRLSPLEFFQMISVELHLACNQESKVAILHSLNDFLIRELNEGRTAALLIDEAHNLNWDVLEEVRMLGNLETRAGKLLQVVLAGQPELDRKLDAPNLRQLKQRIVLRSALKPFQFEDTIQYVESRLKKAGMSENTVLPRELLVRVHERSAGIPRVINAICDNLLLTAFALAAESATLEMLDEVTADLRLEWPGRRMRLRPAEGNQEDPPSIGQPFTSD